MPRTIATNVSGGLTLTTTTDSPVYIAQGVTVANTSGAAALINATPFYWSVTNGGSAQIAGANFGVSLNGAGTVVNKGTISASYAAGGGFSYNTTTHVLGIVSAALYVGGGGVSNATTGVVSGAVGVALGGVGSVVNAGTIKNTVPGKGFAVALATGGSVTNLTGGAISGGNYGVLTDGVASVSNQSGATISGTVRGVFMINGGGSIGNQGRINGITFYGVELVSGGTVGNLTGGAISGGENGVMITHAPGSVTNQGMITGTSVTGVYLSDGGGVSNQSGGTISGGYNGVSVAGATGTITNQSLISGTTVSGVYLSDGGGVSNQSGGVINGGEAGIIVTAAEGVISNQGFIQQLDSFTSQSFAIGGVLLLAGGSVDNAGGTVVGASYGVDVANGYGYVTNTGLIKTFRTAGGSSVICVTGGSVGNSGTISSQGYSVLVVSGTGSVTNSGVIASYVTGGGAGVALLPGGSVTNSLGGIITGGFIGVQFGEFNSSTATGAGTLVNQGTISASDYQGDGAAIWMHGPGVIINQANATIEGGSNGKIVGGPLSGFPSGPFGIVAYYQTTVINYGSIGGGTYSSAVYHQSTVGAKQFAFDASSKVAANTIANLIEMAPGASFGGLVKATDGSASATLELLSGASAGTISSFGTHALHGIYYQGYLGFGAVKIDNGARWTLGGTVATGTVVSFAPGGTGALTFANPSSIQGTITGFAHGDTIGLGGVSVTGSNFTSGVLTLTEAAGSPICST